MPWTIESGSVGRVAAQPCGNGSAPLALNVRTHQTAYPHVHEDASARGPTPDAPRPKSTPQPSPPITHRPPASPVAPSPWPFTASQAMALHHPHANAPTLPSDRYRHPVAQVSAGPEQRWWHDASLAVAPL